MWTTIMTIAIIVGILFYDRLPGILAHRERMAEIKKDKNNE
jgi:hypothetical protein